MSKIKQRKGMIQGDFKVLSNKKVGRDYFKMVIAAPGIVQQAQPGQFVHLRCANAIEPLLRRPFSFHRLNEHNFQILYKIVGRGTNLLAKKGKGDKIDVLGPLGNGFGKIRNPCLPAGRAKSEIRNLILVAGGMGVAPLFALAEKLAHKKETIVLLGAKTKDSILCASDFRKLGAKVQIATDDGSKGYKGFVSELLKKVLRTTHNTQRTTIYACGPKPMLKEVAKISRRFGAPAFASLEENMACGVGACLGCAIKTKTGYQRVCKDGPIFDLKKIKW